MNYLFLKDNRNLKRIKSSDDEKVKQKNKNLSLQYDYSANKFSSGIEDSEKTKQKINLLLSENYKSIFNPNALFKKETINLMKTTEENLISSINNESSFLQKSLSNYIRKSCSFRKNESANNKYEGSLTKKALKFFKKKRTNEIKKVETKHKSCQKILEVKLTQEIEKEKNKII